MSARLKIASVNARSWPRNGQAALNRAGEAGIDILCVQESWLTARHLPVYPGWGVLRADRRVSKAVGGDIRGGGVMILLRAGLTYAREPVQMPPSDGITDRIDVSIARPGLPDLLVVNVYRPYWARRFDPSCLPTGPHVVVVGDFNCHHPSWDSFVPADPLGRELYEWISGPAAMVTWNDPLVPTRWPPPALSGAPQPRSSPDLVITDASWDTDSLRVDGNWCSDHRALCFSVPAGTGAAPQSCP